MTKRKVIVYIAMSADGYIAKPNVDLSFLSIIEKEGQDYGYFSFVDSIDTILVGRKTYDQIMSKGDEFPHANKEAYVITRTQRPSIGSTHFHTDSVPELISKLKAKPGKNIFIDGGAELITSLLNDNLIDEFILSIIPIFVGEGIQLFKDGRPEQKLTLLSSKQFEKGLVQLHYSMH